MKTKNVATLRLRKSSGHSLVRRGFVLLVLALTCFALSTPALAKKKKKKTPPTPTGIIHSTRLFVEGNNPIDTANFTGLSLQYSSGPGEGAIMSSFNDGASVLTFYTKNGPGQPITQRMIIDENGNVGIGSANPLRLLQIGPDTNALFTLEGTNVNSGAEPGEDPNAGYVRFGDNTGWKLHFGRSRESSGGALNTGTTGTLMTIQDNGNVGIGTSSPVSVLDVASTSNNAATFSGLGDGNGGLPTTHVVHIKSTQAANSSCLALQSGDSAPSGADNFITFFNSAGGSMGRIEAVNSTTTTYITTGSDFAETLPVADSAQPGRPAEIVPVHGGEIGAWDQADHFLVITNQAGFIGNDPGKEVEARHHRIAFLGQVPVKIRGAVSSGDYVIASEANDGTGIAKPANKLSVADMHRVVGRAWESSAEEGMKEINTAVGLDQTGLVVPVLERLERENRELRAKLAALEARDQAREARLTRLENAPGNRPARAVNAVLARK